MDSIYAKVICDSVSPLGVRLTSIEIQCPRTILAQILMHRLWSRSCESLRARPVKSKLAEVQSNPFVPVLRQNQKGMQPAGLLDHHKATVAEALIRDHHQRTCELVEKLADLQVAKEIANRYLEPYAFQKVLITSTDFQNFFRLRCSTQAQEEITELANKMKEALENSKPLRHLKGSWHLPYVGIYEEEHVGLDDAKKLSAARCARVSYVNHEGVRDHEKDFALFETLKADNHSNVFEHQCTPAPDRRRYSNLTGWFSQRFEMEQSGQLLNAEG